MIKMDSGLGSDEEQRRSRTKEQKERHNEQLLNGAHCFIDASSLQDEEEVMDDQKKNDERRQGSLLFQTSMPQYSRMLQLPSEDTPTDTPFNSIVNFEEEKLDSASKPSLGFYVDLSQVGEEESNETVSNTSDFTTKNIFSMVIDFEAPKKKGVPSRLLNHRRRASNRQVMRVKNADDTGSENGSDIGEVDLESLNSTAANADPPKVAAEPAEETTTKFVRLSDLMTAKPKVEAEVPQSCSEYVPRMSKSIPESSWVESPLLMSRSGGYRVAPRPLEPDNTSSLVESTGSQTSTCQRRLGTDLLRMFLEETDTDTVLHVGSPPRVIRAHRCILISRCQYFAGTLRGRSLTIEGFSYDAVHFALCHIYSGASHVPDSISLVELASLADMLSLEGLKEVVAHALKSRHCHQFHSPCPGCLTGVLEVLPLSAAYGLDELYLKCLKWITLHYLKIWPNRAFAQLPKELKEKCYQQHVIYLTCDNVLTTHLSCDRLLTSLPTLKWAESVIQLGLQLAQQCKLFISQHYVGVMVTLLDVDFVSIGRVEEIMLSSAEGLNLEQECNIFIRTHNMINKYKDSASDLVLDLIGRLHAHFEKRLLLKPHKLNKCPSWSKMDPSLKNHVRKLAKLDETPKVNKRNEPSRLPRMVSSKTTSSSDSSRNSSPATSQAHPSPSLRRSLLLAAKAPQVPPSPSTTRRISTLTLPTQASSAKASAPRHIKQPISASTSNLTNRNRSASVAPKPKPIAKSTSNIKKEAKKEQPLNKRNAVSATNVRKIEKPSTRTQKKQQQQQEDQKQKSAMAASAGGMQRSSTFLKDEPTVLKLA